MTYSIQEALCFPDVEGLNVRGQSDGGALSSDFGPMLLRGIDGEHKNPGEIRLLLEV